MLVTYGLVFGRQLGSMQLAPFIRKASKASPPI